MPRKKKQKKIFVLDTSVILYNHNAIYSFEDNDVAIPITVLDQVHTRQHNLPETIGDQLLDPAAEARELGGKEERRLVAAGYRAGREDQAEPNGGILAKRGVLGRLDGDRLRALEESLDVDPEENGRNETEKR